MFSRIILRFDFSQLLNYFPYLLGCSIKSNAHNRNVYLGKLCAQMYALKSQANEPTFSEKWAQMCCHRLPRLKCLKSLILLQVLIDSAYNDHNIIILKVFLLKLHLSWSEGTLQLMLI